MTQQAVFDAALADFREASSSVIYQRDLMVVNQATIAYIDAATEQLPEVQAGSNATARAALKATHLEANASYCDARDALTAAEHVLRTATVDLDVARYKMRMAIAVQGAGDDDN